MDITSCCFCKKDNPKRKEWFFIRIIAPTKTKVSRLSVNILENQEEINYKTWEKRKLEMLTMNKEHATNEE